MSLTGGLEWFCCLQTVLILDGSMLKLCAISIIFCHNEKKLSFSPLSSYYSSSKCVCHPERLEKRSQLFACRGTVSGLVSPLLFFFLSAILKTGGPCNKVQFYQSFEQIPKHVCYSQMLDKKSTITFYFLFAKM